MVKEARAQIEEKKVLLQEAKRFREETKMNLEEVKKIARDSITKAEAAVREATVKENSIADEILRLESTTRPSYKWSEDPWDIANQIGWGKRTTDYNIVSLVLSRFGKERTQQLYDFFSARKEEIYNRIEQEIEGGSDDSLEYLCWHIVGLGKKKFDSCTAAEAQRMLMFNEYTEGFNYCFHTP